MSPGAHSWLSAIRLTTEVMTQRLVGISVNCSATTPTSPPTSNAQRFTVYTGEIYSPMIHQYDQASSIAWHWPIHLQDTFSVKASKSVCFGSSWLTWQYRNKGLEEHADWCKCYQNYARLHKWRSHDAEATNGLCSIRTQDKCADKLSSVLHTWTWQALCAVGECQITSFD